MSEIEKVRQEIKVLEKKLELLEEIERHNAKPKMKFELGGKFEIVSYNGENYYRYQFNDKSYNWYKRKFTVDGMTMVRIDTDGETHHLLEGMWFNDVKKGKYDEPYCPDESEYYDEVEWDEKDNPKPMDEVVDRLVKKYQYQKLYNRVRDQLLLGGYSVDCCDEIVDLVEDWMPKEQSAAGSQNVNTELLVEGFNDCVRTMKGTLR